MIVNVGRGCREEDEKGRGFVAFVALSITVAFSHTGRHTRPVIGKFGQEQPWCRRQRGSECGLLLIQPCARVQPLRKRPSVCSVIFSPPPLPPQKRYCGVSLIICLMKPKHIMMRRAFWESWALRSQCDPGKLERGKRGGDKQAARFVSRLSGCCLGSGCPLPPRLPETY